MQGLASILTQLFIIFVAAKLAGAIFERFRQPAVIGELLAGVLIGPYALGLIGVPSPALVEMFGEEKLAEEALAIVLDVLAELGVVILLFFVGLETRLADIARVGVRATIVAFTGVAVPFVLGYGLIASRGDPPVEALFVGAAMVATSVGITARVLADLGQLESRPARIVLGAAVIDDVLGLLILSVVTGIGREGRVNPGGIAIITAQALLFVGLVAFFGTHATRRWSWHIGALRIRNAPFVVAMAATLGLAALSANIGLAAIIGAFLGGMAFAETREQFALERQALPVYELLVPFFFVLIGARVDWRLFLDPSLLGLALGVTVLAILGKLVAGLGAWGFGTRQMALVAVGMVPRGEVGLIVASVGASLAVIPPPVFSTVVIMSVLTTLVVPPVLSVLYGLKARVPEQPPAWEEADGVLPEL